MGVYVQVHVNVFLFVNVYVYVYTSARSPHAVCWSWEFSRGVRVLSQDSCRLGVWDGGRRRRGSVRLAETGLL